MTTITDLYLQRNEIWKAQPHINLAASEEAKRVYAQKVAIWLADMRQIDRQIDEAKKRGEAA